MIREKDLHELARTEARNLPGALFAGTSPLLRPFMKKLEALLPQENKGRGDSYVLCALRTHIDLVHADESLIVVKSGDLEVMIRREELGELIGEKYPTTSHHRLNLPGLLFLQSSPSLQAASAILLRREHRFNIRYGSAAQEGGWLLCAGTRTKRRTKLISHDFRGSTHNDKINDLIYPGNTPQQSCGVLWDKSNYHAF
jgi:hypothetical protein